MRERLAFLLMVGILVFLFAFVFAILGRGSYEPGGSGEPGDQPVEVVALAYPAV